MDEIRKNISENIGSLQKEVDAMTLELNAKVAELDKMKAALNVLDGVHQPIRGRKNGATNSTKELVLRSQKPLKTEDVLASLGVSFTYNSIRSALSLLSRRGIIDRVRKDGNCYLYGNKEVINQHKATHLSK